MKLPDEIDQKLLELLFYVKTPLDADTMERLTFGAIKEVPEVLLSRDFIATAMVPGLGNFYTLTKRGEILINSYQYMTAIGMGERDIKDCVVASLVTEHYNLKDILPAKLYKTLADNNLIEHDEFSKQAKQIFHLLIEFAYGRIQYIQSSETSSEQDGDDFVDGPEDSEPVRSRDTSQAGKLWGV